MFLLSEQLAHFSFSHSPTPLPHTHIGLLNHGSCKFLTQTLRNSFVSVTLGSTYVADTCYLYSPVSSGKFKTAVWKFNTLSSQ